MKYWFFLNTAFLSFYTTISLKLILQLNDNVHVHSNFWHYDKTILCKWIWDPNSCKMILSTGSDISYLTCLTTSITMFHIYVQYRCIIVIQCRHLTGTLFIKFSFNTEDSFSWLYNFFFNFWLVKLIHKHSHKFMINIIFIFIEPKHLDKSC